MSAKCATSLSKKRAREEPDISALDDIALHGSAELKKLVPTYAKILRLIGNLRTEHVSDATFLSILAQDDIFSDVPKAIADLNIISRELTIQLKAMTLDVKETINLAPTVRDQDRLRELRSLQAPELKILKQQCYRQISVIDFLTSNDELNKVIESITSVVDIEADLTAYACTKVKHEGEVSPTVDSIFSPCYALRRRPSKDPETPTAALQVFYF